MQDVLKKLDGLQDKVKELSQKIEYLRKENIMLIEENVKIKQEAEKVRVNHQDDQRVDLDKGGKLDGIRVAQYKKDLDKYIGEVEHCIEIINSM